MLDARGAWRRAPKLEDTQNSKGDRVAKDARACDVVHGAWCQGCKVPGTPTVPGWPRILEDAMGCVAQDSKGAMCPKI